MKSLQGPNHIVSGKKKADALARLLGNSDISEEFPASILRQHNDVTVIADEEALKKINE
ncbi:hypothetical protein NSR00_10880 [Aeribacillus sp. FSL K6-8394]|uniref:hypothetical protein n=1 Tax=Aeribacillus sp. FSL K6-8394 TaxID=2954570 RepID=UPI0030F9E970